MAAHMAMPMNQYHALSDEKNTAIRMIASRSSTVASVIRNARIEPGSALANNASTASEKAMSVAVGIAHPCAASANGTSAPVGMVTIPGAGGANRENREMTVMNSTGGISIPPTAHSMGTAAAFGLASEPVVSSCLRSNPTVRKNIVSRPSCAQCPIGRMMLVPGMPSCVSATASNMCDVHGRLARTRPANANASIIRPEIRSDAAIRRILAQTLPVLFMNPQFHTR